MNANALVAYRPPPAIARAYAQRGYTSLMMEAHEADVARKRRMCPPTPDWLDPERQARRAPPKPPQAPPKPAPPAPPVLPAPTLEEIADKMAARFGRLPARVILDVLADGFGVPVREVLNLGRSFPVARVRQTAMWMHHDIDPRLTLHSLGRIYHRHHATVLHALRVTPERLENDPELAARVAGLRVEVEAALAVNAERGRAEALAYLVKAGGLSTPGDAQLRFTASARPRSSRLGANPASNQNPTRQGGS